MRHASVNASLLYTAKGVAVLLVPGVGSLRDWTGGWESVFALAAVANALVVLAALLLLRPARLRHHAGIAATG